MNSEKRIILFVALTFAWFVGIHYLGELLGLNPPTPPPNQKKVAAKAPADPAKDLAAKPGEPKREGAGAGDPAKAAPAAGAAGKKEGDAAPTPSREVAVEIVKPSELVLKSDRLQVQLEQAHAGVESVLSLKYEAEFEEGKPRRRPLALVGRDPDAPRSVPSLLMTLVPPDEGKKEDADAPAGLAAFEGDGLAWEVVKDEQGRTVRPASKAGGDKGKQAEGKEIRFRKRVDDLGVVVTKTYRLFDGSDAFELELGFEGTDGDRSVAYRLLGPHGIPIEGKWYTGTFRDVFFAMADGDATTPVTMSADTVAKATTPDRFTTLPLLFAGVENQYFATFLAPTPPARTQEARRDAESGPVVIYKDPKAPQEADVTVQVTSKPFQVGPNRPVVHSYRIFAGPKTFEALAPYGAELLATYRKNQWFSIPFASSLAQNVIAPLLDRIYLLTKQVAGFFGGKAGNYGIAIILLTITVRMMMFPLGRKQALMAKKMQELQPHLKELQEKYKDDKEQLTKETWALYKRHKANPIGGCLPALIQMPILVGLWQALNNSVPLRHASFLYIKNLAAPDMLFRFPTELPLLGNYFNLLPFLVVSLMLVQTKLFSPPATTPEAEMQQKMMKYMMIFMAFMFYKVPSGLGIYFIVSSLWSIGERLILPKITKVPPIVEDDPGAKGTGAGRGAGRNGSSDKPGGWLSKRLEKLLDEAANDATYRRENDKTRGKDKDRDADGDRGKPRNRPGRRR